jgi:hypothetical protein
MSELQTAIKQAQKLSPKEQLDLIKCLAEQLAKSQAILEPRYLEYGKYRDTPGRRMSTEEDFKLAEWHPIEEELDGE